MLIFCLTTKWSVTIFIVTCSSYSVKNGVLCTSEAFVGSEDKVLVIKIDVIYTSMKVMVTVLVFRYL